MALCCLLLAAVQVRADEGMWLLPYLQKLNIKDMKAKGLKLSAEQIYNLNGTSLKDAIVIFGGGCTGEIVSPNGLVFTNHHCGYGSIQRLSSVEHDYLQNGFWAMDYKEELPCPGMSVTFIRSIEDVSDRILPFLSDSMSEQQRQKQVDELSDKIVKEALPEKSSKECVCQIVFRWESISVVRCGTVYRPAPGRNPALFDRQIRRRYRQLDVAAPYGRLFGFPGLCR